MEKRRSRLEIILTILTNIREGEEKPTRIMYAANMSWTPTKKILSSLVEQGLIKVKNTQGRGRSKQRYLITEKGINLLNYFAKGNEILPLESLYAGN